ncbi:MAG: BrnA antitoxin family protein [Gammaproteobacteria bacterium]|nr:BrnA antitoxin family protein [Gammaproteobacteria bacterium]
MKRQSASSQPEEQTKKNGKDTSSIKNDTNQEAEFMKQILNGDIDYSDIPELDFDDLGKPTVGKFYRPIKKQISIRIDADTLDWFKQQPGKYQQLINAACRLYMTAKKIQHTKKSKRG